jgi:hypothetical protein
MDSYDVLVIILSVTLAVFLVLSIIATVLFIKLLKKLRQITDTAQAAVENVEHLASSLQAAASSSVVGGLLTKVFDRFKSSGKGRK